MAKLLTCCRCHHTVKERWTGQQRITNKYFITPFFVVYSGKMEFSILVSLFVWSLFVFMPEILHSHFMDVEQKAGAKKQTHLLEVNNNYLRGAWSILFTKEKRNWKWFGDWDMQLIEENFRWRKPGKLMTIQCIWLGLQIDLLSLLREEEKPQSESRKILYNHGTSMLILWINFLSFRIFQNFVVKLAKMSLSRILLIPFVHLNAHQKHQNSLAKEKQNKNNMRTE